MVGQHCALVSVNAPSYYLTARPSGYEASVSREIAVLRLMTHPGVARMVASFRWRTGAYLVLEYASRGDLHTQVGVARRAAMLHANRLPVIVPLMFCPWLCSGDQRWLVEFGKYAIHCGRNCCCLGTHSLCWVSAAAADGAPTFTEPTKQPSVSVAFLLLVFLLRRFVFGDLKPENVLLTDSGHAKLTDFGAGEVVLVTP